MPTKLPGWATNRRTYRRPTSPTAKVVPSVPAGKGPFYVDAVTPEFGGGTSGIGTRAVDGKEVGVLQVPMSESDRDVAIRVHEYAHLEYDREVPVAKDVEAELLKQGLDERWRQAGGDVIVNTLARQRGLEEEVKELPLDPLPPGSDEETQALWMLRSASRTGKLPSMGTTKSIEGMSPETYAAASHAYSYLAAYGMSAILYAAAGDMKRAANHVKAAYSGLLNLQRMIAAGKAAAEALKARSTEDIDSVKSLKFMIAGHMGKPSFVRMLGGKLPEPGDIVNSWGELTVHVSAFDRTSKKKGVKRRPSFLGAMRAPFRLLLPAMDGRAWAVKKRFLGGTILIDHSGSMSLTADQIQNVLLYAPLATIACYSGSGYRGNLWVLAKNGRYTSSIPGSEGGNVVDGPALHWLAKQGGPRVWISDGGVTGHNDHQTANLVADAFRIARLAGAVMFPNIPAYLEALGITPKDTA